MTALQLDLFGGVASGALFDRAPPEKQPEVREWFAQVKAEAFDIPDTVKGGPLGDERPHWKTRAFNHEGLILAYRDAPAPIEVVARGIPCVVSFGICTCTHAIDPPGSPFWSETGFRSFGGMLNRDSWETPEQLAAMIEQFIDAPPKDGNGLGGELVRWWPWFVMDWVREARFLSRIKPDFWAHKGEEEGRAIYAEAVEKVAKLRQRVIDAGVNPREVAPELEGPLL